MSAASVAAEPQVLGQALDLAARGFAVFPVNGKVPFRGARGFKDASCDPDTVRAAFEGRPGAGIGVATGAPSRCFVVDLDEKPGQGISGTAVWDVRQEGHGPDGCDFEVQTPSGGRHKFYRQNGQPTRTVQNASGLHGVDIRGDGGYVVFPSSNDPDRTIVTGDLESIREDLADPPDHVFEIARKPEAPTVEVAPTRRGGGELTPMRIAEIRGALEHLDPDPFELWRNVGMALKTEASTQASFAEWCRWASGSSKFDAHEHERRWEGFHEVLQAGDEITLASIFAQARSNGWQGEWDEETPGLAELIEAGGVIADDLLASARAKSEFPADFIVTDDESVAVLTALGVPVRRLDETKPVGDLTRPVVIWATDQSRPRCVGYEVMLREAGARSVTIHHPFKNESHFDKPGDNWTAAKELERWGGANAGPGARQMLAGIAASAASRSSRARRRSFAEFMRQPDFRFRMAGWMPEQGVAVLAGQQHTGKSIIAVDQSLRCVFGGEWCGHEVRRRCSSLYIVGEDPQGLMLRAQSWVKERIAGEMAEHFLRSGEAEGYTVDFVDRMPSPLAEKVGTDEVERLIRDFQFDHGHRPGIVWLDTMATLFGGDENDNAELGRFAGRLGHIADEYGVLIVLVHHLRKPASVGRRVAVRPSAAELRGASAMAGNFDHVWLVWRKDEESKLAPVEIFVDKGKNGGTTGSSHWLTSRWIELRKNDDGDVIGAPILTPTERPDSETAEGRHRKQITNVERLALSMVLALRAEGQSGWVKNKSNAKMLIPGNATQKGEAFDMLEQRGWIECERVKGSTRWTLTGKAPPASDPRFREVAE